MKDVGSSGGKADGKHGHFILDDWLDNCKAELIGL